MITLPNRLTIAPRLAAPLLVAVFIGLALGGQANARPAPIDKATAPKALKDGLRVSSARRQYLDEEKINAGIAAIREGAYGNIHSVLIFRRGKLVSESYFPGDDENNHQGKIGRIEHSRDTLHDVRSVSKSVVALALLIAHHRGHIKNLNEPLFNFFPEYSKGYASDGKSKITVRHLLTMTAGLAWNEDVPYGHADNTPAKFAGASDPIGFVLARPLVTAPGAKFLYNGGLTQLLAAIVKRSTGQNIEQFTRANLLSPLGIRSYEWAKRPDGEPDADSGLRLRSRDLAKIGLLIRNKGRWRGRQLLPVRLVDDAVAGHIVIPQEGEAAALGDRQAYGYQIWRSSFLIGRERVDLIELSGNGGQKVYIDDAHDLMLVTTAGNYDRRSVKKSPLDVYFDIVHAAVHNQ